MERRMPLIQIQKTAYTILPVVMLSLKNIAKSKFLLMNFHNELKTIPILYLQTLLNSGHCSELVLNLLPFPLCHQWFVVDKLRLCANTNTTSTNTPWALLRYSWGKYHSSRWVPCLHLDAARIGSGTLPKTYWREITVKEKKSNWIETLSHKVKCQKEKLIWYVKTLAYTCSFST